MLKANQGIAFFLFIHQPKREHRRSERNKELVLVSGGAAQTAVADRAFRDAQAAVGKADGELGLMVHAKERTQRIIETCGRDLGWEIQVQWREP